MGATTTQKQSLQQFATSADLYGRIRQDRQQHKFPILLVEGNRDKAFWDAMLTKPRLRVFSAGGRDRLIEVARELGQRPVSKAICFADRDFNDEWAEHIGSAVLYFSDGADLDSMLISSPALERFISIYGAPAKLLEFGGPESAASAMRDRFSQQLGPLSKLRRGSAVERSGISFKDVPLEKSVDKANMTLDINSFVDRLFSNRKTGTATRADIGRWIRDSAPVCKGAGGL